MSNIEKFSPTNLDEIRAEMKKAMAEVEKKFGIKVGLGKITFTENEFTTKMTAMVVNERTQAATDSNVDPKWVSDFMRNHIIFGLSKDDLGREVTYKGMKLKLVGSRCRANLPLVVREVATGALKTFSVELFKKSMA